MGLFLVAAIAGVGSISSDAKAAVTSATCSVTQVGWRNDMQKLLIICDGVAYWTPEANANSGCGIKLSMDVIKMFESIATSADLSGKKVQLWWDTNTGSTCSGDKSIRDLYLLN
jgi:hypothetical protein